jgi:hypothetical protein
MGRLKPAGTATESPIHHMLAVTRMHMVTARQVDWPRLPVQRWGVGLPVIPARRRRAE